MKRLVFMFVAMVAMTRVYGGNKTAHGEAVDTFDTAAGDTVAADTVAADTL